MNSVVVIGAGTMGNGIAHISAQFGYQVTIVDVADASLQKGRSTIEANLARQVKKGTLTDDAMAQTLSRISLST
ncbi:MAG: NAD-binding protein, partial [Candidatus Kapabacteria bacterium]|nr:NAD-binding protein [Candidatus Kapabacteria bacterium]